VLPTPAAATAAPDALLAAHDLEVGTFYFHRGDYVGALARYQDAIQNQPRSAEAYCRAGDAEMKLQRPARAEVAWRRCLQNAADQPGNKDSGHWVSYARQRLQRASKRRPAA
jgi:outer membrane protein assembly factor BamD (BamD/ComL family)